MCVRQYIQIHGVAAMNDHSMKKKKKKKTSKESKTVSKLLRKIVSPLSF